MEMTTDSLPGLMGLLPPIGGDTPADTQSLAARWKSGRLWYSVEVDCDTG